MIFYLGGHKMKKLGKKTGSVEMTIEAYAASCSCGACSNYDCRRSCYYKPFNEVGHLQDKHQSTKASTVSSTRVKPK